MKRKDNSDVTFVKDYEPDQNAWVELRNGRIVDVINAGYFDEKVKLIVRGRRIAAMPGLEGQPTDIKADLVVDFKGKTVMPGLFNTHCHTTQTMPSLINGVACLAIEEDFGSIETGKVADLAILGGDPFESDRVVGKRVTALFLDGQLVVNNCKLQVSPANGS